MKKLSKDYVGTQVGFVFIKAVVKKKIKQQLRYYFVCVCKCGNEFVCRTGCILQGITKSCGCMKGELLAKKLMLPREEIALRKIYDGYKYGAKKRKLQFLLSFEEFKTIISKSCFYCDALPSTSNITLHGIKNTNYLPHVQSVVRNGIDRLNNEAGYVADNCVPCCKMCNGAKSDHSLEEFQAWIDKLIDKRTRF